MRNYLQPSDFATFLYCPTLYNKKKQSFLFSSLSFVEEHIKYSIINAERNVCIKDSVVTPKKIINAWDKLWWPFVSKNNIPLKEAEEIALKVTYKFSDYCKYDISDWDYPTAGVNATVFKELNNSVLTATADVIKVNTNEKYNTVLILFNKRDLSLRESAIDISNQATAYAFHSSKQETITVINVNINEDKDKLHIVSSTYRPEDMDNIKNILYYAEYGIIKNVSLFNRFLCKECKQCKNFTL